MLFIQTTFVLTHIQYVHVHVDENNVTCYVFTFLYFSKNNEVTTKIFKKQHSGGQKKPDFGQIV